MSWQGRLEKRIHEEMVGWQCGSHYFATFWHACKLTGAHRVSLPACAHSSTPTAQSLPEKVGLHSAGAAGICSEHV